MKANDRPVSGAAQGAADRRRASVLVVDDHPLICEALTLAINGQPDLMVCGCADSPQQALTRINECLPHIVLLDLSLNGENGLELLRALRSSGNKTPVLVLSMHREDLYANSVLRNGGQGYIQKDQGSDAIVQALRKVLNGNIYLSERQSNRALSTMIGPRSDHVHGIGIERLSEREREILDHVGRGMNSAQIAKRLHISPRTVETHRTHIKTKLGLDTRAEMLHIAIRWVEHEGIINPVTASPPGDFKPVPRPHTPARAR